jgi:hypothetical protein
MFRACTRFLFAVLIGVCGTLAWQRYGDQATELAKSQIAVHGPSVAQFLTAAKSALPRLDAAEEKTKPALAASGAASVPAPEPASAPAAELATNVEAKPSLDAADTAALYQEVQYVTSDLAAAKKTIEQLSASQDQLGRTQQQMAQSIAKLQTLEEGINQKLSSVPSTTVPVHLPAPKPVQNRTPRSAHAAPKPLSAAPPPVPPGLVR